ncbi:hypothetical protein L6R52_33055, partial [Myxococcota bacterium]|nr:hypothetical protein [Myxococcota bacterium]
GDGRSSDAARGDGAAGAGRTGGLGAQVQAQAGPGSGSPSTGEGAEPWLGDRPTIARLEPTIRIDLASLVSLVERAVPALAGLCVAAALGLSLVAAHEAAVGETELGQALRARVHAEAATPVENRRHRGERCAWELELMVLKPWVARDHASVERDNPRVERWLSRPEADAHVVVFAEPLAEGTIADLDDVRSVILGDANVGFDAFELVTESAGPRAATLEARATVEGRRFVQLHRVVSAPGCIVHVVGFAPESRELEVGDELRRILDTLKLAAPRKADRIQRSSETARSTRS